MSRSFYQTKPSKWRSAGGRIAIGSAAFALGALLLLGCQDPDQPDTPSGFGQRIPWVGMAFDILAADLDGDSRPDLTVVDHGGNQAQIFYQQPPRQFTAGPRFDGVGFHPGNLFRWPGEPARFLLSAEGDNAIRVLSPDKAAGFKVESQLEAVKPRYGNLFRWPGWGDSLVLSPFDMDSLFLLKRFDPGTGKAEETLQIALAEQPPSVLWPGPLTVTDIDRDGSDDILYATPITRQVFAVQAPKNTESKSKKKAKGKPKPNPIKPRLLAESPGWGGPTQVLAADLDRDGADDLLVPDETKPGKINVIMNDGQGQFTVTQPLDSPNELGITKLQTAIDHDGQRYILAAGFGVMALHQVPEQWQVGQPMVSRHVRWKRGDYATALALHDLDGDGWLDAVLARQQGGELRVLYGPLWENFKQWSDPSVDLD